MAEHSEASPPSAYSVTIYDASLNQQELSVPSPIITGHRIVQLAGHTDPAQYVVLRRSAAGGTEETADEDELTLSSGDNEFWVIESDRTLRFVVNEVEYVWPENFISGQTLRTIAHVKPEDRILLHSREGGPSREIDEKDSVDLALSGLERFQTEVRPPSPHIIFINDVEHTVLQEALSGAQIKALGGIESNYQLFLEQHGDDQPVANNQSVRMRTGERFYSLPPATFG